MKKALLTLLLLCCAALLVWVSAFFWKNLRGAGPALKSPSVDIVRLIEKLDTDALAETVDKSFDAGIAERHRDHSPSPG